MHITVYREFFLFVLFYNFSVVYSASQVFGKYGSVKVDIGDAYISSIERRWASSWPEGIRLSPNLQSTVPNAMKFYNTTGYPYSLAYAAAFGTANRAALPSSPLFRTPRTFSWNSNDELVINCMLFSSPDNPSCTRLSPPLSWLTHSKVRVSQTDQSIDRIEITTSKQRVEGNLGLLRGAGMAREDIFRMLDKGPWILAFDLSVSLPKLIQDIQTCFGSNVTEAIHIISHCPFLLVQYCRYKGRDISATVMILNSVNYFGTDPLEDIKRFPTILATPPERIRGWLSLLQNYGVANDPKLFGKMLRRSPFMFYRDAACLFYEDELLTSQSTKTSTVVHEARNILDLLSSYKISDLDKVVRTQPNILLLSHEELQRRINFLLALLAKETYQFTPMTMDTSAVNPSNAPLREIFGQSSSAWTSRGDSDSSPIDDNAVPTFRDLLLTYPGVLSIDAKQMRGIGNALRASGLSRAEVTYLIKSYPFILKKSPEILQNLLLFLKSYCGFHKSDIIPSISRYPNILSIDVETLKPKVDYLYKSIGGTSSMLRKNPNFLCYDLDQHIKPRSEFLKAFDISPASLGLSYLLTASPRDLAKTADVDINYYNKFCASYSKISEKKNF